MLETITLTLTVDNNNEYLDDYPTHLKVTINKEFQQWISKMSKLVKRNYLCHIAKYDWTPDFFKGDINYEGDKEVVTLIEYERGTEGEKIYVRDTDFFWKGLIKHTDAHYESDTVTIKQLNNYFKLLEKPLEEMPKYLNDEDEVIKDIAIKRMAEGV